MRTSISLRALVPLGAVVGIMALVSPIMVVSQTPSADPATKGARVFATNCSFCHGGGGIGHDAPRLADRGLQGAYIEKVIADGVPETAMTAWRPLLSADEYGAVVAYVKSLNGIAAGANGNATPVLSEDVVRGRALFRDATRELAACSNCHAVDGRGVDIVPLTHDVPSEAKALRNMVTAQMKTVVANGRAFPARVVAHSPDETKIYDFTAVPPVLRIFPTSAVKITEGSRWRHASIIGTAYSDQELNLMLGYLRTTAKP